MSPSSALAGTSSLEREARRHRPDATRVSVTRTVSILAGALAVVGLMAGCASSGGQLSSDSSHAKPAEQQAVPEPNADADVDLEAPGDSQAGSKPGTGAGEVTERSIRVTSDVRVKVEDIDSADQTLTDRVQQAKGHFDHRAISYGSHNNSAEYTVRIPAEGHDSFLASLGEFGTVTSATTDAEDVTLEKVDLESRIASLESSIKSLREMLEQAKSTSEMLEIERELSDREADLASLKSQLDVLNDEVTYSTVNITMSTEYSSTPTTQETGFFTGIQQGWEDMIASSTRFIERFGYALPGLILLALIGTGLWLAGLGKLIRRMIHGLKHARPNLTSPRSFRPNSGHQEAGHSQQPTGQPVPASIHQPTATTNASDQTTHAAPNTAISAAPTTATTSELDLDQHETLDGPANASDSPGPGSTVKY